jgi:hypothetical protein
MVQLIVIVFQNFKHRDNLTFFTFIAVMLLHKRLFYYGSTALCCALAVSSVFNPIHSRLDSLDGESARRKASTYTQNNTNTE